MNDKPLASPSLGIEVSATELKGAYLTHKSGQITLEELFGYPVDREHNTNVYVKPLYKENEEHILHSLIDNSLVITGVSTKETLIRVITLQLTKESDIEAVLEFQAEPLLPFPIEESLIDRVTLFKDSEFTKLAIVATKSEQIAEHLEKLHSAAVEPEVISCTPMALAAFSEKFYTAEPTHIHIHFGTIDTSCILVNHGKLAAAQSTNSGLEKWIDCLSKDLHIPYTQAAQEIENLDFATISEDQYPLLVKHLEQFGLDIARIVFALKKLSHEIPGKGVLVTGEGSGLINFPERICKKLEGEIDIIQPEQQTGFDVPTESLQRFAIPIGLALTALPNAVDQVNFRQKDYSYPNPWKRVKKPLMAYLASCFLLAGAIYFFGNTYVANKEDNIKKEYVDLLTVLRKPHKEFEAEIYTKAYPGRTDATTREYPVLQLTEQDIKQRLSLLEKEIRQTPDIFPLYPNIPKVSDVLAWLSTHPHILGEDSEESNRIDRIRLESFSYKIVKRPEQNKKREKYQAKVEIEFTTATPRIARELHDILLAPNKFIDPSGEVKWTAERNRYRASFFLKDKTNYPRS